MKNTRCPRCGLPHLTEKERQIVECVVHGKGDGYKAYAAQLQISEQTLKNHVSHMFNKFGVNSMVKLVLLLLREGVVQL